MDSDYPTDDELKRLETRDWHDANGALEYVRLLWKWCDRVTDTLRPCECDILHAEPGNRYLRCSTGGWSGNEDVIGALRTNFMVWALTWRLTSIGGLHIFQYRASN